MIICGSEVKVALLFCLVPRPALLAHNRTGVPDYVIRQSLGVSQNAVLTNGTRVNSVDMSFECSCGRTDNMANDTLGPRRMFRNRMGLQASLTFKFFVAKIADETFVTPD